MRKLYTRGLALVGALGMAATLSACSSPEQEAATDSTPATSAPAEPAETQQADVAAEVDREAETVPSIEAMVAALQAKNYACKDWERTDDVEEAAASGTCNGTDSVMVFDDNAGVQAKMTELEDEGTAFVHGENWIVADTITPTFVRNALGGTAVAAGGAE